MPRLSHLVDVEAAGTDAAGDVVEILDAVFSIPKWAIALILSVVASPTGWNETTTGRQTLNMGRDFLDLHGMTAPWPKPKSMATLMRVRPASPRRNLIPAPSECCTGTSLKC